MRDVADDRSKAEHEGQGAIEKARQQLLDAVGAGNDQNAMPAQGLRRE